MDEVSAEQQLQNVIDKSGKKLSAGDQWYVIPSDWWTQFGGFCGFNPINPNEESDKKGGIKPGKISYTDIVKGKDPLFKDELKDGLIEHRDFELVSSSLYEDLESWEYTDESLCIPRNVIDRGKGEYVIELYPVFIRVSRIYKEGKMTPPIKQYISHTESFHDLMKRMYKEKVRKEKEEKGEGKEEKEEEDDDDNDDNDDERKKKKRKRKGKGKEKEDEDEEEESEEEGKEIPGRIFHLDKAAATKNGQPWKLLNQFQLHQKIDVVEVELKVILMDFKINGEWCWPKDGRAEHQNFLKNITEGDTIDAKDHMGKWYEAEVLYVEDDLIKIHYGGFSDDKWDEEIPKTSVRLAPKGKYTNGPHVRRTGGQSLTQRHSTLGAPIQMGAVGLRNLGNTCFMNSTLQCLSNTPNLTEYFRDDTYQKELNKSNPLGYQGKVAGAYADLIKEMWSSKYKSVAPVQFKRVIGEFQPRFSGYQQHDSSELLHFLLDGLHEDLNRVQEKPMTEQVESKGRADAVVAKEAWDRHLKRNRSIIVDQCQGQLKSTVVCPDCPKKSTTFDPYMFLSVPIPDNTVILQVTYKPLTGGPMIYGCKVPKRTTSSKVLEVLSKNIGGGVTASDLRMVEIWSSRVFKVFKPTDHVPANDDDIWVFQQATSEEFSHLQLLNKSSSDTGIGTPALVTIPSEYKSEIPFDTLRNLIKDCLTPFLKGGWQTSDTDTDMYTIGIYDTSPHTNILKLELSYDDTEMVCIDYHSQISLGIRWKEEAQSRLIDESWPKHESATVVSEKTLTLNDCFVEFTKKETLDETDAWYCNQCKKHQCADKKIDLFSVPDTLIIHLKRFHYDRHWRNKIDTFIDFPIEGLDMSHWISNTEDDKSCIYNLFAVSNHFGNLGGGHYTAYAKNILDNKWYNLDDSCVTVLPNANKTRTNSAYVLFYQRQK